MASSSPRVRGLSFSVHLPSAQRPRGRTGDEVRFSVLIAADVSGRAARDLLAPLAGRAPRRVDVDRLEDVMRGWGARLPSPLAGSASSPRWLEPRSLDDLHPDQLLVAVPELSELLEPGRAASSVAVAGGQGQTAAGGRPAVAGADATESHEAILTRLLGASPPAAPAPSRPAAAPATGRADVGAFIRAIVANAPAAAAPSSASGAALLAARGAELEARLRALLGHGCFRELEARWRSIDDLCRRCPAPERVRCAVLDASLAELAGDAAGLAELLGDQDADVLLVDHLFAATDRDLRALDSLLAACQARGVTLLTGARPELAGCASFAERADPEEQDRPLPPEARAAWEALQARRGAGGLLLALPRVLLRQPYGAAGEPLERLPFEELVDPRSHEAFCWGNGAYLVAHVLARLALDGDGARHPDGGVDVRGLPVVHLEGEDGTRIEPCAESWLSERAVGRLRAAGFAVLQGQRDSDRVRVYV